MRIDPAGEEPRIIERIADFSGMRVLEVGSGDGRMTGMLSRRASSVLSIDTDADLIAKATEGAVAQNVEFRVADVCDMPLRPGEFDAVFLALSL